MQLFGQIVYLEKDVRDDRTLLDAIHSHGMSVVDASDILKAHFYVAKSPGLLGTKAKLAAVMSGGICTVPKLFTSGGVSGTSIVYNKGCSTKRSIYISADCKVASPQFANTFVQFVECCRGQVYTSSIA